MKLRIGKNINNAESINFDCHSPLYDRPLMTHKLSPKEIIEQKKYDQHLENIQYILFDMLLPK